MCFDLLETNNFDYTAGVSSVSQLIDLVCGPRLGHEVHTPQVGIEEVGHPLLFYLQSPLCRH